MRLIVLRVPFDACQEVSAQIQLPQARQLAQFLNFTPILNQIIFQMKDFDFPDARNDVFAL